jgi:hypothetical protein
MVCEAQEMNSDYPQKLVQIMREHELILPGEEEQMTEYLFRTA